MNTKIRIRLLLVVLAFGLAVPSVASADSIPIAYVIYQNSIGSGPDNPGTNDFYFEWLVDPLDFTEATFSVTEIDAYGSDVVTEAPILPWLLDYSSALEGFSFPTTARLSVASFWGLLEPGVFMTLDGQAYALAATEVTGGMAADSLGLRPFGLNEGDSFVLEVQADPIPVPVPEGGPGTLALTTWALLLAAAARRVRP